MKKFVFCGLFVCFAGVFGMPPSKDLSRSQGKNMLPFGKGHDGPSILRKRSFHGSSEKSRINNLEKDNKALKRRCREKEEESETIKEGNRNLVVQNKILAQENQELRRYYENTSKESSKIVSYIRSVAVSPEGLNDGAFLNAMSAYCKDQMTSNNSDRIVAQNGEYSELFNYLKQGQIRSYLNSYPDKDVPMNVVSQFVEFMISSFKQGFNFLYNELEQVKKEGGERFEELSENNRQLSESNRRLIEQGQMQNSRLQEIQELNQRQYEELWGEIRKLSAENAELKARINDQVGNDAIHNASISTDAGQSSVFGITVGTSQDTYNSTNIGQFSETNVDMDISDNVSSMHRSIRNKNLSYSIEGNFVNGRLVFSENIEISWGNEHYTFHFDGQDDGSLVISAEELSNAQWMNNVVIRGNKYLCLKENASSDEYGIVLGKGFIYRGKVVHSGKPSGEGVMFLSTGKIRKGSYGLSGWLDEVK